jgi:hypothetical protein
MSSTVIDSTRYSVVEIARFTFSAELFIADLRYYSEETHLLLLSFVVRH